MIPWLKVRNWSSKLIAAFILAVVAGAIHPAPASAQDEKGPMDEQAISVLKQMSDYLGGSETIAFRARTFFDVVRESGIKIKAHALD